MKAVRNSSLRLGISTCTYCYMPDRRHTYVTCAVSIRGSCIMSNNMFVNIYITLVLSYSLSINNHVNSNINLEASLVRYSSHSSWGSLFVVFSLACSFTMNINIIYSSSLVAVIRWTLESFNPYYRKFRICYWV